MRGSMVKSTSTTYTHRSAPTLFDYGFRSVKLRTTKTSYVESVGSNDVPVYYKINHRRKMPRGVSRKPMQRSENVRWCRVNEAIFIELMHDEFLKGQLQTTSFSKYVMGQICMKLNALVSDGSVYNLEKCKTKFARIKKAWKLLYRLKNSRGSGLTWDHDMNTVIGEPSVLQTIYDEHPDNKGIMDHGLPKFDLCTDMFVKIVATGEHARSSMQPPVDSDDDGGRSEPQEAEEPCEPFGDQSTHNFAAGPSSHSVGTSSQSSRRKRSSSASEKEAVFMDVVKNFGALITEKRVKREAAKDELKMCINEVKTMNGISQRLVIKAANAFTRYTTRQVFLSLDSSDRRAWVEALDD